MLLSLIIIFSITAAFLNAVSVMIQRYETGQPDKKELYRRDFSKTLTKNPKWIGAFGLQALAFLFQAAALRKGSLLIVEPLLSLELVFLMILLHFRKNLPVGKREWLGIALICVGLSGTLIAADPHSGQKPYALFRLVLVISLMAGITAIAIYIVRRSGRSKYRAAISAIAAALSFALVAVFTKIVTGQLSHGLAYVLSDWQIWGLCLVGIVSIILMQNSYGAGPVAISQPTMGVVEPVVSIILGIYLFGDRVNLSTLNLLLAIITAVMAGIGITLLSRSKKLDMELT